VWARWIALVAFAALLVACAFRFDDAALKWVATHRTSGWLAAMEEVSHWGDWPSHVIVALVLAAIAYAKRNRRWLRIFLAMLIACALAGTAARVVKMAAGRARPSVPAEAAWNGPQMSARYHAFPSGHTASSAAFFGALLFLDRRRGALFLWIPLLIAFSRVYVGAHYLSDVVCAALLGIAVAWVVARWRPLAAAADVQA
jgi:undecaprenyl-diphosphatase